MLDNKLYVDMAYNLDTGEPTLGGFVELVGVYGTDAKPAEVARISYAQADKKNVRNDARLVEYLWANKHTSPFEFIEIEFVIRMPIFVARQFFRHRTANVNEMSMRYSRALPLAWIPDEFRIPDKLNKQGSIGTHPDTEALKEAYINSISASYITYLSLINKGVAKEQARAVLPVSMFTEVRWKQDFKNLAHLLALRLDHHAQQETRMYATAMYMLIKQKLPHLISIFDKYSMGTYALTRTELELIMLAMLSDSPSAIENASESKSRREYLLEVFKTLRGTTAPKNNISALEKKVLEFNRGA